MRTVLTFLLAGLVADAAAQIVSRDSVHLKPLGSQVRGEVVLVNKTFPLPEGEFAVVAIEIRDSKFGYGDFAGRPHRMVDVVLGQFADGKLRAAAIATTVLAWGGGRREWTDDPCKRDDTLFRLNRVSYMKRNYSQDCLLVNHTVNSLGQAATGIYAKAAGWFKDQGGVTPIPTLIQASVTRIEIGELLIVHYAFDPRAYGCDAAPAESWVASAWHKSRVAKDRDKERFVANIVDLGKELQLRISEDFGRGPIAEGRVVPTPKLQRCGVAVQVAPSAKPEKSESVAERLRTLESLKEQKLISPEEYDERRRKILDSL